jgi:hypothetical protein
MLLKIAVGDFKAHFRHFRASDVDDTWTTECFIHKAPCVNKGRPCGTEGSLGVAQCSPKDIFSRAEGRKLALQRTMISLLRADRALIWKAYFALVASPIARSAEDQPNFSSLLKERGSKPGVCCVCHGEIKTGEDINRTALGTVHADWPKPSCLETLLLRAYSQE